MWERGVDVSKPELLTKVLGERFTEQQIRDILAGANNPEFKQALNDNTKAALERGAFGCPWFWVKNSKGEEEPFFGSDRYVFLSSLVDVRLLWNGSLWPRRERNEQLTVRRFHFMWQYLGLPWKDVELVPAPEKAKI